MNSHYTIHTLPILRNEIKMYPNFKKERDKLIQEYVKPLRALYLEFYEVEEELIKIKSPGKGDGLGGYVQESDVRFNNLINVKDKLKKEMKSYVANNRDMFLKEIDEWNRRIVTVEYYLSKMDAADRKFIEDLYINRELSFKQVMDRYNIRNEGNLYRKSNNILRKVLKR